jgi:hypothetical protein
MKSNLFLCTTQYHLFLSLHIIEELYNCDGYKNYVIITIGMRKANLNYNKKYFKNVIFSEVDWDELRNRNYLKKMFEIKHDQFFYFLSNFPVHRYIVRKFSNVGTKIILVQDGMKAYVTHLDLTIKGHVISILTNFLEYYKIRYLPGIFFPYISINYVNDKKINEFWLTHPSNFTNNIYKNQLVYEIPKISEYFINKCSKIFNYQNSLKFKTNDILYLTQALVGKIKYNEFSFLQELSNKFPKSTIYIKFHPSPLENRDAFKIALPNAVFLSEDNYPAELLIQNLDQVIILSGNSSAFFLNNEKCRFYFIYPILNKGFISDVIEPVNCKFSHVINALDINDIQFFN